MVDALDPAGRAVGIGDRTPTRGGHALDAVEGLVDVGADLPVGVGLPDPVAVGVVDEDLAGVAGIGSQRPMIEFVVLEGRRALERAYVTLDDRNYLKLARQDPEGFLEALPNPVTINEIQRVPELTLAIKRSVDRDRQAGRYLLTGSANLLQLPRLADSLAGRMKCLFLQPLTEAENEGRRGKRRTCNCVMTTPLAAPRMLSTMTTDYKGKPEA